MDFNVFEFFAAIAVGFEPEPSPWTTADPQPNPW